MEINQPAPLSIGFSIAQRSNPTTERTIITTTFSTLRYAV